MKKLTLNVEELNVSSFETTRPVEEDETARHAWSDDSVCPTTSPSERRVCV